MFEGFRWLGVLGILAHATGELVDTPGRRPQGPALLNVNQYNNRLKPINVQIATAQGLRLRVLGL